jgi:molecular chaperone GrpE
MKERDLEQEATEEQDQDKERAGEEASDEPIVAEREEEAVDEVSALLEELEEAKRKEAEYLDGWQRARAELANARKRFQREQEQAYAGARADVLVRMLPVVDDFERAFATLPEEMEEEEKAWLGGVRLIWRKFQALLQQEGVSTIEAVGQEFDPYLHQAVTHEPSETVPEGHVIDEMQRGYQMDGRVLRPSIVRVSSGLPEAPKTGDQEQEAEEAEIASTGDRDQTGKAAEDETGGDPATTNDAGSPETDNSSGQAAA